MNFSRHVFSLHDVSRNCTLPGVVKIEHGPQAALKESHLQPGDIVQVCEIRTIQTVTGYLPDKLEISNEILNPDDLEIVIPLAYPGLLKVINLIKNYSLVSDIYNDWPRFVRVKEKLAFQQGTLLITIEENTKLEIVCRLQGVQRVFNQRGVDKIIVKYDQDEYEKQAEMPVNTRGVFRSEPDGTSYTIAEAIDRYALPNVKVAFEENFLPELLVAHNFPDTSNVSIPDIIELARVETQEMVSFCKVPETTDETQKPECFAYPLKNFENVYVRVLKEDGGSVSLYQCCTFKGDSSYEALFQKPWLIHDCDYEPVHGAEYEDQMNPYKQGVAGKQEGIKSGEYVYVQAKSKEETEVVKDQMNPYKQKESDDKQKGIKSGEYVYLKPESNKETGAVKEKEPPSKPKVSGEHPHLSSLRKKFQKLFRRSSSSSSAPSSPLTSSPPASPLSPPSSQHPLDPISPNKSRTGMSESKEQITSDQTRSSSLYDEIILNSGSESSETEQNDTADENDYIDMTHVGEKDTREEGEGYTRMIPKDEKDTGKTGDMYLTPLKEIKAFEMLDVEELCERLRTCGMENLAKVAKSKFLDGYDLSQIETDDLMKEPYMITKFDLLKLTKVKNNWVPNLRN